MGCHSTLFGPVKYAYLPQHLSAAELTSGNGLVEMGTFIAILLGTMAGGILAGDMGAQYVAWACVIVAVLGRIPPPLVPHSPAPRPDLAVNLKPGTQKLRKLALTAARRGRCQSL